MKRTLSALYQARSMSVESIHAKEEQYINLCQQQAQVESQLLAQMSDECKKLFHRYFELEQRMSLYSSEKDYIVGFRDGLRMNAWALARDTDPSD